MVKSISKHSEPDAQKPGNIVFTIQLYPRVWSHPSPPGSHLNFMTPLSRDNTMKRFCAEVIVLLSLLTIAGCKNDNQAHPPAADSDAQALVITLGPESSIYDIEEVFKGAVQFAVSVENRGGSEITFAHPVICFPENHRIGDSLNIREYHGKSEILLTVEKPDGSVVTLRDGPHFFDPDNASYFIIDPGESDLFYIGWFFQNARGGWEDNIKAENVFTGRGLYRLKLLYRNFFPKALIHDAQTSKSRFTDVWTGEIQSNEVVVTIQ